MLSCLVALIRCCALQSDVRRLLLDARYGVVLQEAAKPLPIDVEFAKEANEPLQLSAPFFDPLEPLDMPQKPLSAYKLVCAATALRRRVSPLRTQFENDSRDNYRRMFPDLSDSQRIAKIEQEWRLMPQTRRRGFESKASRAATAYDLLSGPLEARAALQRRLKAVLPALDGRRIDYRMAFAPPRAVLDLSVDEFHSSSTGQRKRARHVVPVGAVEVAAVAPQTCGVSPGRSCRLRSTCRSATAPCVNKRRTPTPTRPTARFCFAVCACADFTLTAPATRIASRRPFAVIQLPKV